MSRCGNESLQIKFEKYLLKRNPNKIIPPSDILIKPTPYNPYCSSITGKYIFDLSKIVNMKVYFWRAFEDINKNEAIKTEITDQQTTAENWPDFYKDQTVKAIETYAIFCGKSVQVVNSYDKCDWVCVLLGKADFLGACYGPDPLYNEPTYVDNRVVYFINGEACNDGNMTEGGDQYLTLIHEAGHGFGLAHPHDRGFGSSLMPGIILGSDSTYTAIAGYIQNTMFNTVMTYNAIEFFLPADSDNTTPLTGYASTLMPLDILALRWMYSIQTVPGDYSFKYGVTAINPEINENNMTRTIVGYNRNISFGQKCTNVEFYFNELKFDYNSLAPLKYSYNRIIEKSYSFYPMDVQATIASLTLNNTGFAFIFIEKNGIKINLTVNVFCKVCKVYILEPKSNYTIKDNVYTNKTTKKVITFNKPDPNTNLYVYFDK